MKVQPVSNYSILSNNSKNSMNTYPTTLTKPLKTDATNIHQVSFSGFWSKLGKGLDDLLGSGVADTEDAASEIGSSIESTIRKVESEPEKSEFDRKWEEDPGYYIDK